MPPGKKRGAKGAKAAEFRLGDLVLAKVKGFPHWPAKISEPEAHKLTQDSKKYFVEFFGTGEIAFVAPGDIQAFTSEKKNELTIKRQKSKTIKFFAEAVEQICAAFEMLRSSAFNSVSNDNAMLNLASETNSQDAAVDGALKVGGKDRIDKEGPDCRTEIIGTIGMCSVLEGCSQKQDAAECEDIKSGLNVKHNLPPQIFPGKNTNLAANPVNEQEGPAATTSPSHPREDGYCGIKVEGNPDGDQSKLTNDHQPNQSMVIKKESKGAGSRNSDSAISNENAVGTEIETPVDVHKKVSSVNNLTSGSDVNSERKDKWLVKEKKDSEMMRKKLKGAGSRNNNSAISHENAAEMKQIKSPVHGHKVSSSVDNLKSSQDVNREKKDKRPLKKKKASETVDNVQVGVMKKKLESAVETKQMKSPLDGHKKVSSADNLTSGSDGERKDKRTLEEKKDSETADNVLVNPEENPEHQSILRKKVNAKRGRETPDVLSPVKMSKHAIAQDTSMVKAQTSRKNHSKDPNVNNDKITTVESKRSSLGGKAENHNPARVQMHEANPNHSSDEDDLPPMKRHRRALEAKSSSLASEIKLGTPALRKNDLLPPNRIRSSGTVPAKRRAVLMCDDDEDELPKTPVHGGSSKKVSAISRVSDSKKKLVMQGESNVINKSVSRNFVAIDRLAEQAKVVRLTNRGVVPTARQGTEKLNKDISHVDVPPSTFQSQPEKLSSVEPKTAIVSPIKSPRATMSAKPSAESQNKLSAKGTVSDKKAAAGSHIDLASAAEKASLNQLTNERSKPASSGEKGESTPKSDFIDSVMMVGNPTESVASLSERLDFAKDKRAAFSESKTLDSVSMRNLIAAAQARKKQAHTQNSYVNSLGLSVHDTDMLDRTPSPAPAMIAVESTNTLQLEVQGSHPSSLKQHENEEQEERRVSSGHQATGSSLSGGTEAAVARDAFEGMIETLSRTKESIGRATRLAIDCAKYGIANEVMELLIKKLENERSNHRRVDLFFLVDSITQCSHQKGVAGASYIPIVQAALPRLIGAAAPPGSSAQENRRQCHKVLRLWLERKILPESVLRRYMDEIGVTKDEISAGFLLRRPSREERAIDDPIREMEGMFVDEYGSNATFQLPGLLSIRAFDEDEDEDDFPLCFSGKVADTSPSLHTPAPSTDPENNPVTPSDRRHCILEDVDGELEMEDVSGHPKDEKPLLGNVSIQTEHNSSRVVESGSSMHVESQPYPNSPPLPDGTPPPTPVLPTSPPPPLSPPLPPPPSSSPSPPPPPPPAPPQQHMFLPPPCPVPPPPYAAPLPSVGPPLTAGRPPALLSQQPLQHQPVFMSQHMPPLAPLARDIGSMPAGNHRPLMVPNQGSHFDSSLKSDVMSQQSSCFPSAGINNAQETNVYNAARPVEYGQVNTQQRQQFVPVAPPFAQRPLHPERPPQFPPNHFSYGNSAPQYHYPPYQMPNFPDGSRRSAGDEQWRMKAKELNSDGPRGGWMTAVRSSSGPYPHEGYYGQPTERPPLGAVPFQPSRPDTLPTIAPIPVHGASMMSGRPDMSSVSWRPA